MNTEHAFYFHFNKKKVNLSRALLQILSEEIMILHFGLVKFLWVRSRAIITIKVTVLGGKKKKMKFRNSREPNGKVGSS